MIFGGQREIDHRELEAYLVYIASSVEARSTHRAPISKQIQLHRFNTVTLKTQNTKVH